jgi:hypothetical protein
LCKSHFCELMIAFEAPCLVCACVYRCFGHFGKWRVFRWSKNKRQLMFLLKSSKRDTKNIGNRTQGGSTGFLYGIGSKNQR